MKAACTLSLSGLTNHSGGPYGSAYPGMYYYGLGAVSNDSAYNSVLITTLVLPARSIGVKLYERRLTLWLAILGLGNRSSPVLRMSEIGLWSTVSSKVSHFEQIVFLMAHAVAIT